MIWVGVNTFFMSVIIDVVLVTHDIVVPFDQFGIGI